MTSDQTCRCGRPLTDAFFCDTCADELTKALGDIPWLEAELEVSVTGSRGVDYRTRGGTASSEIPSPVAWSPADARRDLLGFLIAWVKHCDEHEIRHQSPNPNLPTGTLTAMSRYLLWRVDGLSLDQSGPAAVQQLTTAVARCHRVIDSPADRQFLGRCDNCHTVGDEGRLYARPGAAFANCDNCGQAVDAAERRAKLLEDLDDRLCTAAEIAHLSTYLGLKADRYQVRKRINRWAAKGTLAEAASISDEPTFRFGTVYRMLVDDEYGKAPRTTDRVS